jgi:ParB family chromosome partitioning protein
VDLSDKEAFEVSLIENIQRRTLHPIEEAEAFRKYVTEYGWGGVSELARRIGKSQEYVSKRMRLLTLPKEIKDELTNGRINPSVAEEILSLDNEVLQLELGYVVSSNNLTLKETRSISKMLKKDGETEFSDYHVSTGLSDHDRRRNYAEKALRRVIVVLRTALFRLDETIEDLSDEWILRELLLEYRLSLHNQISLFIKARKRLDHIFEQKAVEVIEGVT